jgi:hypothetical protein
MGFLVEDLVSHGPLTWLEVQKSSFLSDGPDGMPSVARDPPARPTAAFRIEQVAFALKTHLLLISPEGKSAGVNGVPAPRVALLGIKDQVAIHPTHVLHVSGFFRPVIGPPEPELIGQTCMVCQTPFKANTIVCRCWSCAVPLHAEDETFPAATRLECGRLSANCPRCGAAMMWKEGFVYVPEV